MIEYFSGLLEFNSSILEANQVTMGLNVGIIQSNYLPWRGYFDFIGDVDLFIIYDHVQYTKHGWRNRNRIKTSTGPAWITVPVQFSLSSPTSIDRTLIDYHSNWVDKLLKTISQAYGKSPFYKDYQDELFSIFNRNLQTISELNVQLIHWVMKQLAIDTPIRFSKDLLPAGRRTDALINILQKVGAKKYLSGPTGRGYLDESKFLEAGIDLVYKVYDYPDYPQLHGRFEPQLSVIDLLFNCGPASIQYLKSRSSNQPAF